MSMTMEVVVYIGQRPQSNKNDKWFSSLHYDLVTVVLNLNYTLYPCIQRRFAYKTVYSRRVDGWVGLWRRMSSVPMP